MKILILGATGNLGRLTAQSIATRSPDVRLRLTSHRESGAADLRSIFPSAEVLIADWYDESSLRIALQGVDKILMVTPDFATDEQVVTPNLIRAVKATGGVSHLLRFICIPPAFSIDQLTNEQRETRCGAAMHLIAKSLLDSSGLPLTYVNVACWITFNLGWFIAPEVKASRRLLMPAAADAARQWVDEHDIADVFAAILCGDAKPHVGREYLVTGDRRYTFAQVAALLSEVLGEKVTYVDDDAGVRSAMGELFDKTMIYFSHETQAFSAVPSTRTAEELLGRPQIDLKRYIQEHRELFI
jgi:NAD(P)H dehydrogenase (quinone)